MGIKKPTASNLALAEAQVVRAAYHEAGHAVVGKHLTGERPRLVSIERGSENIDSPGSGFIRWGIHVPAGAISNLGALPTALRRSVRASAECWARLYLAGYAVEESFGLRDADDPFDLLFAWDVEQNEDVVGAFEELRPFEKNERKCWSWMDSLWADTKALVAREDIRSAIGDLAELLLNTPTLHEEHLSRSLAGVPFDISQMERPRFRRPSEARGNRRPKPRTSARTR